MKISLLFLFFNIQKNTHKRDFQYCGFLARARVRVCVVYLFSIFIYLRGLVALCWCGVKTLNRTNSG
jgi:hypothetical protein